MGIHDKSKPLQPTENHVENGLHQSQLNSENYFLSGIKQRLLSFIFRGIWNEETNHTSVGYISFQFDFAFWFFDI